MARRFPLLLIAPIVIAGCLPRGFNRAMIYSRLNDEKVEITEEEISKAVALRPQLSFPCRIAVYLSPKSFDHWTAKDKELIEAWAATLKKEGIAEDMFLMSELFATGTSLKDMRIAAARHGANALLVLQGGHDVRSYNNASAVFNLTVVGGFVVPASHRDALFVLQGGLVDVGNGFLYASIEAEGQGRTVQPSFLVEDHRAIEKAKQKALANFGPELLKRLRIAHTNFAHQPDLDAARPVQP